MTLHPLAERFAQVADRYERGRPDYPPEVVRALTDELSLAPGARVLDLAAGTGKLTRALVAAGLDVAALEPQQPLREVLAGHVGEERVHDGVAEAIPFADGSFDAVTVADAFHWFSQPQAIAEIARVLRPGGGLAVLSTAPDWQEVSWAHELGELVTGLRPEHPNFDGPPWQEIVRAAGGWSEPREVRVVSSRPASAERVVDHIGSISWVAALPADEQEATLARAREILAGGHVPDALPVVYVLGLSARP